jgi:putative transposase
MKPIVCTLLLLVSTVVRSRLSLQLEIVALRHQLAVYQRTTKRPQISSGDRILWSWLASRWSGWRDALVFVQTGTVIAWQRKRFRDHWAKLSKHGKPGRPPVPNEIRALIRKMSEANISWGSPRIVGELRKLGIDVAKSTVERYRVRSGKPPSPTWKAFLNNHVRDLVSIDFFVVPTVRNKVLFVLVVSHITVAELCTSMLQSIRPPNGPVSRSLKLPLGYGPEVSTAGPGCYLWEPIPEARPKHGH